MGLKATIQNFFDGKREASMLRARNQELAHMATESKRRLAAIEHLSILLSDDPRVQGTNYIGNAYQCYEDQILELDRKYRGVADWGNQIASNIVDIRGAFTIGQGVKPKLKPGKETKTRELEFVKQLMEENDLDQEVAQDWATEAELEGKFLCRLFPNPIKRTIDLRFIPWVTQRYTVLTPENDYLNYIRVEYNLNLTGDRQLVGQDAFVYKKFGGRKHLVNEAPPKIAKILTAIENLDKAMWDWRKINHFFSAPTPYFECPDADSAKAMQDALKNINWKIGKALAGTGKFSLQQMNGAGIAEVLEREVTTSAKIVSAGASIPVHFLGFPDLMSNRSTSTDLFELIQAGTNRERKIWIGFYEELFRKAIRMQNAFFQAGLDEDAVGADIPFITAEKMRELVEIWLPMYTAGTLSLETFLSKVPEIDAEEEIKRIEDRQEADLERLKAEADLRDPAESLEIEE